jgi:hypothetical protein
MYERPKEGDLEELKIELQWLASVGEAKKKR